MNSQITLLHKLIAEEMAPEAPTMQNEEARQWIKALPRINENIFIALRDEIFGGTSDRLLERHIHKIQSECVLLMDVLQSYVHTLPEGLTESAAQTLEQILTYIEKHHAQYFNLQAQIPQVYFKASVVDINRNLNVLKAAFKRQKLELELSNLLMNTFLEFTTNSTCTYNELLYIKALQTSLIRLCNDQDDVLNDKDEDTFHALLLEHLLYLRFNSLTFLNYYKQQIVKEATQQYNVQEQYELLCRYENSLKTQQERTSQNYIPSAQSARIILLNCIKAEQKYLLKKVCGLRGVKVGLRGYGLTVGEEQATAMDLSNRLDTSRYRIKTTLSVDGLAYLVRLLVEVGAINGSPRKDLLFFMSRSLETPGSNGQPLGLESLLSKYKRPVQSTANSTRVLLKKMLKILEDGFG